MYIELPDVRLTAEAVSRVLTPSAFVKNVLVFDSIDSTNAHAKILIGKGSTYPALVIAEEQTQGRGRFDRKWVSEKGKNLTFTLLLKPQVDIERRGLLPLCVAESIARSVVALTKLPVETKWPNDLLVEGKKFCGILLESVGSDQNQQLIIGIGLNVNQVSFPPDLHANSLMVMTGKQVDRLRLLSGIIRNLRWLATGGDAASLARMVAAWKKRCHMFGKTVRVRLGDKTITGVAKDVAPDGALVLEGDEGTQSLYAGDVTVDFGDRC